MRHAARAWYEALRTLERRAAAARRSAGGVYSRRETARALARPPYGVQLKGQRLSSWLPEDPSKAQVPRFADSDTVWALVRLWSSWCGDPRPDRSYWTHLLEEAQPARPGNGEPSTTVPVTPAAPPAPLPRELPRPAAEFTGREEELAALCEHLLGPGHDGGTAVVCIDGMGGMGKSALAVQVAHQVAARFPDGQLYVNLQGATPGLVPVEPLDALGRMLRALGCDPGTIPGEVQEAAARFRSLTAGCRLLILLDDAGDARQVRPLLPGGPGCAVLVTSRRPLVTLEGAYNLRLDLLTEEQALALLGRLAGARRVAAEARAAAAVIEACGRLPLALRIAGGRLASRPTWRITVLADLLADANQRLETLEALAVDEMAVRPSFDVSLSALRNSSHPLDQAAATAFGLLSAASGPDFGILAAARALDRPEPVARALLERLVDAQLLEAPRPDRYRFHDLVRLYAHQFAAAHCAQDERNAFLTRLIGFYTATAWRSLTLLRPGDYRLASAEPRWSLDGQRLRTVQETLEWLELERDNLLAAVTQAAAAVPALSSEAAGRLSRALSACLDRRGYWRDAVRTGLIALELAERYEDRAAQAYAHNDLGFAYRRLGHYEEAIRHLETGLSLFRDLDHPAGRAYALANLGSTYGGQGRLLEAIDFQHESLAIWRDLDDLLGQATALINLGHAYRQLRRYDEAMAALHESMTLWKQRKDRRGRGTSLGILGVVYRELGRFTEAAACHHESLAISRELGDLRSQGLDLYELGILQHRLDRPEEALALLRESLTIFERMGHGSNQVRVLRKLTEILRATGHHEQARAESEKALRVSRTLRSPEEVAPASRTPG
ncbi:tetratricopeptide repeat protein [Actinomadura scrupuli]|uniref:tetratricopeptide repeat protein n=1 Tax=Actinomadura scrupuli TaxID=559629 RepID=UPI003D971233